MNYLNGPGGENINNLVLDKSYLWGYSKAFIHEKTKQYKFLFTDTLTFEVAKDNAMRANLFGKIPSPPRLSAYIPSLPRLIQLEIKELKECGKPSQKNFQYDYSLLPRLSDPNIPLSKLQIDAIEKEKEFLEKLLVDGNLKLIRDIFDRFSKKEISNEVAELRSGKIKDHLFMNRYLSEQRRMGANIPNLSCFTENSVTYRFYQIMIMFSYDTCNRYENFSTIQNSEKALEKLRHDINDMSYLIIGLLEGGFAVKETKLIALWKLLKGVNVPESQLQT